MIEVRNGSHLYRVDKQVGETGNYRLYLCSQDGIECQYLLQIATALEQNGGLDRAAYVLKELKRRSDELEAEYAHVKTDPNVLLNYDLGFPELIDSFVCQEQGGRRINILAFKNVEDVSRMVPLTNITEKDRRRVDLRTSAWVMGKLLKLLVFAHNEGIAVGLLNGNNVVIEPDEHYVVIFDWSEAQTYPEEVPTEVQRQEISRAAQLIVAVIGGDFKTGIFPDDANKAYTDYIMRLARGDRGDTEKAHEEFYELIDKLWERKYYPFTTESLNVDKIKDEKEE